MLNWFRLTVCLSPDRCFSLTVHYFSETWGNYKITDMFSVGGTKGREWFFISLKTRIFVTHRILSRCSPGMVLCWLPRTVPEMYLAAQGGRIKQNNLESLKISTGDWVPLHPSALLQPGISTDNNDLAQTLPLCASFLAHSYAFSFISESHLPSLISSQDIVVRNI